MLWGRHKKHVLGKNGRVGVSEQREKARVAERARVCKNDGVQTKTSGQVERKVKWQERGALQLAKPSCNCVRARPGHESVHETC
jgi:hypothetical protein